MVQLPLMPKVEAKPECLRCTSTGRKCDGYTSSPPARQRSPWTASPPSRPKTKPRPKPKPTTKALTPLQPTTPRSASPLAIRPSSPFRDDKESLAFAFFLSRTAPHLAGHYPCAFWSQILPAAAHHDPGIRHAVYALASAHRLFEETGEADSEDDVFGMTHYQLAIRQHIEDLSRFTSAAEGAGALAEGKGKEGLESYLASSMLFICIEMVRGHFVSAISLTKIAVQLFYTHVVPAASTTTSPPPPSPWPLALLEALLARLQAKAIGLVGRSAVGILIAPRITKLDRHDPVLPSHFATIEDARNWYDAFDWAHNFSSHDPEVHGVQDDLRDPVMHRRHERALDGWSALFDALLGDMDVNRMSQRERNAVAVLQVRRWQSRIAFQMVLRDELGDCNPMLWDEYGAHFAEVLDRLETVLRTQDDLDRVAAPSTPLSTSTSTTTPGSNRPRTLFSLDFGLVAPLYEIARLCRTPHLRRRAIALLRAHPMREGMWDSLLAARAAEAQMELEEGMALDIQLRRGGGREDAGYGVQRAEDVPRDARIITLLPDFVPGRRWARVFFSRLPAQSPGVDRPREWHFQRVIEW